MKRDFSNTLTLHGNTTKFLNIENDETRRYLLVLYPQITSSYDGSVQRINVKPGTGYDSGLNELMTGAHYNETIYNSEFKDIEASLILDKDKPVSVDIKESGAGYLHNINNYAAVTGVHNIYSGTEYTQNIDTYRANNFKINSVDVSKIDSQFINAVTNQNIMNPFGGVANGKVEDYVFHDIGMINEGWYTILEPGTKHSIRLDYEGTNDNTLKINFLFVELRENEIISQLVPQWLSNVLPKIVGAGDPLPPLATGQHYFYYSDISYSYVFLNPNPSAVISSLHDGINHIIDLGYPVFGQTIAPVGTPGSVRNIFYYETNIIAYSENKNIPGKTEYWKPFSVSDNRIHDKKSSYALIRTNPLLSGNVKIVVDSNEDVYLDSIESNSELSNSRFKKYRISTNGSYINDVRTLFSEVPASVLFDVYEYDNNYINTKREPHLQYDFFYAAGTKYLRSKFYNEEFVNFAPIWIKKDLPEFYIICKVKGPLNESSYNSQSEYKIYEEVFNNFEIIKTYDIRETSKLGKYIRSVTNHFNFKDQPLTVNYNEDSMCYYTGIDYKAGSLTSKAEYMTDFFKDDQPVIEFEERITNGFKRNEVLCPNLLNLEFLFDDTESDEYAINRYFGFYVNQQELYKFEMYSGGLSNSGNLPLPKKTVQDNLTYNFNFTQTNESGIKLPVDWRPDSNKNIIDGKIPLPEFVNDKFRVFYVRDKNNQISRVKEVKYSSLGNELTYNYNEYSDIVLYDTTKNIGSYTGITELKTQTDAKIINPPSHIRLDFYFNESYVFETGEYIEISYTKDPSNVLKWRCIANSTGLINGDAWDYPVYDPSQNLYYNTFSNNGTLSDILNAFAKCINKFNDTFFNAVIKNNSVYIISNSNDNEFLISRHLVTNSIIDNVKFYGLTETLNYEISNVTGITGVNPATMTNYLYTDKNIQVESINGKVNDISVEILDIQPTNAINALTVEDAKKIGILREDDEYFYINSIEYFYYFRLKVKVIQNGGVVYNDYVFRNDLDKSYLTINCNDFKVKLYFNDKENYKLLKSNESLPISFVGDLSITPSDVYFFKPGMIINISPSLPVITTNFVGFNSINGSSVISPAVDIQNIDEKLFFQTQRNKYERLKQHKVLNHTILYFDDVINFTDDLCIQLENSKFNIFNDKIVGYENFKISGGLLSFIPIKDIDFDYIESDYSYSPNSELLRYYDNELEFNETIKELEIHPNEKYILEFPNDTTEFNVKFDVYGKISGEYKYIHSLDISANDLSKSYYPITTYTPIYHYVIGNRYNGKPQPWFNNFSVIRDYQYGFGSVEMNECLNLGNPIHCYYDYFAKTKYYQSPLYITGNPYTYTGKLNLPITNTARTGNLFSQKFYKIIDDTPYTKFKLVETERSSELSTSSIKIKSQYKIDNDLKNFNGFLSLKDFTSIEDEQLQQQLTEEDSIDRFFTDSLKSEYGRLREYYTKELCTKSRVVPYIYKWVQIGTDCRDNQYRLTNSLAFGKNNFSPNINIDGQSPENFTHEWFNLDTHPANYENYANSRSYMFEPLNKIVYENQTWEYLLKNNKEDWFTKYFTSGYPSEYDNEGNLLKRERIEHYSFIEFNNLSNTYETLFKGVKYKFHSDAIDFTDFKFSVILSKESVNKSNDPISIDVVVNEFAKNVLIHITIYVEDYRFANGNLDYTLLYACKSAYDNSFTYDTLNPYSISDISTVEINNRANDSVDTLYFNKFKKEISNYIGLYELPLNSLYQTNDITSLFITGEHLFGYPYWEMIKGSYDKVTLNQLRYLGFYSHDSQYSSSSVLNYQPIKGISGGTYNMLQYKDVKMNERFSVSEDSILVNPNPSIFFNSSQFVRYVKVPGSLMYDDTSLRSSDLADIQTENRYGSLYNKFKDEYKTQFFAHSYDIQSDLLSINPYLVGHEPYFYKTNYDYLDNPATNGPIIGINNYITAPWDKNWETWHIKGGRNFLEKQLGNITVSKLIELLEIKQINNNFNVLKYISIDVDGIIHYDKFSLSIEDSYDIIKDYELRPVVDEDKPAFYQNNDIIGFNLEKFEAQTHIKRHRGNYEIKTKDVVSFWVRESEDITNYYEKDFILENTRFFVENIKFGKILNLFYNKISENEILNIVNEPAYQSNYPLVGEYTLDYKDYNIFKTNWDKEYYDFYTSITSKTFIDKISDMKEQPSFFGSKVMNTPNTFDVYTFDSSEYDYDILNPATSTVNLLTQDSGTFVNDLPQRLIIKVNFKLVLWNRMLAGGFLNEFLKIRSLGYGISSTTTDEDIKALAYEYFINNIFPLYDVNSSKLFYKITTNDNYIISNNEEYIISNTHKSTTNYKTEVNDSVYTFDILLDSKEYKTYAFSIQIKKI